MAIFIMDPRSQFNEKQRFAYWSRGFYKRLLAR